MTSPSRGGLTPLLALALATGVAASAGTLIILGYGAVRGWQDSAGSLSERRAQEAADLLLRALTRDMRGAQERVLTSPRWDEVLLDPPHDVVRVAAAAFARYPYPDAFFAWRSGTRGLPIVFFTRSERPPAWLPANTAASRFPVTVVDAPSLASRLLDRIRRDAQQGRRFSAFEIDLGSRRQQVVARLLYRDALREKLEAVFGFTVDLAWVREQYFREMVLQVSRISGSYGSRTLVVRDARGMPVTEPPARLARGPIVRRSFPLRFFDPAVVEPDPPRDLARGSWAVEVQASADPALAAALGSANRTLALAALAAATLVLGLALTVRAARASARLAEMRSEFVASVTHELKTPVATIRALGDTLVAGRVSDAAGRQAYAQLVVQEAKRLARLIDNLLAYARVTDVADVYHFEAVPLADAIDEVLGGFRTQLRSGGFDVQVSIPEGLPAARGDRTALRLLLENLVDNAVRYSRDEQRLEISARPAGGAVELSVSDRGIGIPDDELDKVANRFFRGRHAVPGGSGLGLAIARRIAEDHGGRLQVSSSEERGTTVTVRLPAAP